MTRDAAFYFANLGADVARCVHAAQMHDESRYAESLERAHKTLAYLRHAQRPEAYEEGLLMLRGLALAQETSVGLTSFQTALNSVISSFVPKGLASE